MPETKTNNLLIAKNTIFMYIRMLIIMLVSLYTSRVVLNTLGVDDFGIYNIVGGIVVLFAFINQAMSSATQRNISYELGKKDGNVSKIFSACLKIHIIIAVIIIFFAETIGLWFLNTQMNFPEGRMKIVNLVYQFSILGCIANIIRVPYNAAIIAYERLSFYAISGIVETILKLCIVYLLYCINGDKLFIYSVLMFCIILFTTIWYCIYCLREFHDIKIIKINDTATFKKIMSFSGWAMFGSIANVGLQQGVNIVLNIFYGVTVNAAVGIANQINAAILQFVGGFQQALNPQLIKSEASNDSSRQFSLICKSAKLSYLIMLIIAVPVMFHIDFILHIWLGEYPLLTDKIAIFIIIGALIECLSGPLWVTIFATGKIKLYQIIISSILLMNIPCAYILSKSDIQPQYIFLGRCIIYVLCLSIRLLFLNKLINLNIIEFTKRVIFPIVLVSFLYIIPIFFVENLFTLQNTILSVASKIALTIIYGTTISFFIGLSSTEKKGIISLIKHKYNG